MENERTSRRFCVVSKLGRLVPQCISLSQDLKIGSSVLLLVPPVASLADEQLQAGSTNLLGADVRTDGSVHRVNRTPNINVQQK